MDYQVSARKHRPMTFTEVSGQPHVVRTLTNAIASGRTAHAYLFSGMRGVGKTTMARILAKALNCEKGPTSTPCLACPSCQEIGRGSSFDVLEIDGASSNSVDDVREMRETIKMAPAHGRYRVYIIDEVHMLSTAAFNALLKTLEEPPGHVIFIFATTESHKIPQTILSRCQHFTFRRISRGEIMENLKRVAEAEGITVDDRSLSALARASDGSMRDALSLLDQAVSFGGKHVTGDDLMALLGSVPRELLRDVVGAVLDQDGAKALRALSAVQDRGCDVRQFCGELVEHIRNVLVAKVVAKADDLIELAPEEQAEVKADAARLTLDHIQELLRNFLQAEEGLRISQHPWFALELSVVRACRAVGEKAVAFASRPESERTVSPVQQPRTPEPISSSDRKKPEDPVKLPELSQLSSAPSSGSASLLERESAHHPQGRVPAPLPHPPLSTIPVTMALDWEAVVAKICGERPNLGAFLEDAALVGLEGSVVTIGFPPSAGFSMKRVQQAEYKKAIVDTCHALSGLNIRLQVVALDGGAALPTVAQLRRMREAETERHLREEALENPLVKEALSVFGGELKEVRSAGHRGEGTVRLPEQSRGNKDV